MIYKGQEENEKINRLMVSVTALQPIPLKSDIIFANCKHNKLNILKSNVTSTQGHMAIMNAFVFSHLS